MALWRKMNNPNLSKHLQNGWIKTIKWFLGYSLLAFSLLFIFNIFLISTEDTFEISVKERIPTEDTSKNVALRGLEIITQVKIDDVNFIDRILIGPVSKEFYFFSIFFGILICWFLIRILNDLDFYHPFTKNIAKRIRSIAWILVLTSVFHFIRHAYLYWRVKDISTNYYLELNYNTPDAQSFKYGIILFIIYKVYLYGCELQKEQDLTV